MLFKKIITGYSKTRTKAVNSLTRQGTELLRVTYSYHWISEGYVLHTEYRKYIFVFLFNESSRFL